MIYTGVWAIFMSVMAILTISLCWVSYSYGYSHGDKHGWEEHEDYCKLLIAVKAPDQDITEILMEDLYDYELND